jgi:hypothetical protein
MRAPLATMPFTIGTTTLAQLSARVGPSAAKLAGPTIAPGITAATTAATATYISTNLALVSFQCFGCVSGSVPTRNQKVRATRSPYLATIPCRSVLTNPLYSVTFWGPMLLP